AGSFFIPYNLATATLGEENLLEVRDAVTHLQLRPGQDYYPLSFSASARVRGGVKFAGFGIAVPALSYDDYREFEQRPGHLALVLEHEPGERDPNSPFDGVVSAEISSPLRKALLAQERGA